MQQWQEPRFLIPGVKQPPGDLRMNLQLGQWNSEPCIWGMRVWVRVRSLSPWWPFHGEIFPKMQSEPPWPFLWSLSLVTGGRDWATPHCTLGKFIQVDPNTEGFNPRTRLGRVTGICWHHCTPRVLKIQRAAEVCNEFIPCVLRKQQVHEWAGRTLPALFGEGSRVAVLTLVTFSAFSAGTCPENQARLQLMQAELCLERFCLLLSSGHFQISISQGLCSSLVPLTWGDGMERRALQLFWLGHIGKMGVFCKSLWTFV